MLGLFLPSTEVLLEHVAKETSNTGGQEFLNLAKGATNGLIAGQITNVRDKLTLLGAIVVGTVVVGTAVVGTAVVGAAVVGTAVVVTAVVGTAVFGTAVVGAVVVDDTYAVL